MRKEYITILYLSLTFIVFSGNLLAAEITYDYEFLNDKTKCTARVYFDGEIVESDAKIFESGINLIKKKFVERNCGSGSIFLNLNSKGGDVDAALKIGKIARKAEIHSRVFGECYSSCVFILAGSVTRYVQGRRVGIHRPYLYDSGSLKSSEKIDQRIKIIQNSIKLYLEEMNVPSSLFDFMNSIPPEEMKILSESEMKLYLLHGDDPVYNEKMTAKLARWYGLTSSEYRRRDARADSICDGYLKDLESGSKYFACRDSILYGISKEKYYKYNELAFSLCQPHLEGNKNNDEKVEKYYQCHVNYIKSKK